MPEPRPLTFAVLLVSIAACVPHEPVSAPNAEPGPRASPLAALAPLVGAPWRVGFDDARSQVDTWFWGPGRRSLRGVTASSAADGESTAGVLRIVYAHPERGELRMVALSSADRLTDGVITVDDGVADIDSVFFDAGRPGVRRPLRMRWAFDGTDRYTSTLWEAPDGEEPYELATWRFGRAFVLADPGPRSQPPAVVPTSVAAVRLASFGPLLGTTWRGEARVRGAAGADAAHHTVDATIEWIPFADAVYARVAAAAAAAAAADDETEPTHLVDAYVYHHPATDTVRILALTHRGRVFEGHAPTREAGPRRDDGSFRFELTERGDTGLATRAAHVELGSNGLLRIRVGGLDAGGDPPEVEVELSRRAR